MKTIANVCKSSQIIFEIFYSQSRSWIIVEGRTQIRWAHGKITFLKNRSDHLQLFSLVKMVFWSQDLTFKNITSQIGSGNSENFPCQVDLLNFFVSLKNVTNCEIVTLQDSTMRDNEPTTSRSSTGIALSFVRFQQSNRGERSVRLSTGFILYQSSRLKRQRTRTRTAKLSLVIVAGFVLCYTPYAVVTFASLLVPWQEFGASVNDNVSEGLLILTNSYSAVVNPVLYGSYMFYVRGMSFRNLLTWIFAKRWISCFFIGNSWSLIRCVNVVFFLQAAFCYIFSVDLKGFFYVIFEGWISVLCRGS